MTFEKISILCLITILSISFGQAQIVNIPDSSFKYYLVNLSALNTNADSEIQVSEALAYDLGFSCSNLGISDLTGIGAFINLYSIGFRDNNISSVDLSNNLKLQFIDFKGNSLSTFDASIFDSIQQLNVDNNDLTQLIVGNQPIMTSLRFSGNSLTTIDASACPSLTLVNGSNNDLVSADFSGATNLDFLNINANELTQFNLSTNTNLRVLYIYDNNLSSLDLTGLTVLETCWLSNNNLTSIDFSSNVSLTDVFTFGNSLNNLDLSMAPDLFRLNCSSSDLFFLNVANGTNATTLTNFDAGFNPNLTCIKVDGNIDPSNPPAAWVKDATASYDTVCYTCPTNAPSPVTVNLSGCDSIMLPSGKVGYQSGTVTDTLYNSLGCDSIINYALDISYSSTSYFVVNSCEPTYTLPSGFVVSQSDTFIDYIPNAAGCDSIITIELYLNDPSFDTLNITACNEYVSPSGTIYTMPGTYMDTIPNSVACDSIITINLSIDSADITVLVDSNTITATAANASYQWLDCTSGNILTGETDSVLTLSSSGSFSVLIDNGSCTYTSPCYDIVIDIPSSIRDKNSTNVVFPNPLNSGQPISVQSKQPVQLIELLDLRGKLLQSFNHIDSKNYQVTLDHPAGMYLMLIHSENGDVSVVKVLVE